MEKVDQTKTGTVVDASALFALTVRCKLHPVVVFSILDHFSRRNEKQVNAIGTLLGVRNEGVIEITNSFPVPHTEEGSAVTLNTEFHKSMYELHQRANVKEVVVGWYTTDKKLEDSSYLAIHDFYWKEMQASPVLLMVDPGLTDSKMSIVAQVASQKEGATSLQFQQVQLEFNIPKPEQTGLDVLIKGQKKGQVGIVSEFDNMENGIKKLIALLDESRDYVQHVLEGKEQPNVEVGRLLYDTLFSLPKVDTASFEKLYNKHVQDLLMVAYLSKLTRTHLTFADKLQNLSAH